MRIALGQVNPIVGAFADNLDKITAGVESAIAKGCDLVMFPELTLCGYPPEDLLLNRSFIEANKTYLKKLISRVGNIAVICGFAGSQGNSVYNSAAVIQNRKLLLTYNKVALPNYGVFDEKRYFQHGSEMPLLRLRNNLIGINI